MDQEEWFRDARECMVRDQIEQRGVCDPRLLEVMARIPRHLFVPPYLRERAYMDGPLPIGQNQTISQPFIVAAMTNLLRLDGSQCVLEVGTGSGYQAAVLGEMGRCVHTIEIHAELACQAHCLLERLGYANVFVHEGDGTLGWPAGAPFQSILVTAAAPEIPRPLIDQLDEGGTLVIPVGYRYGQDLEVWRKQEGDMRRETIFPVAFVPLRGAYGWHEEEWEA